MNFLDKAIAAIDPRRGVARAQARFQLERVSAASKLLRTNLAYAGARDKDYRLWNASQAGPNSEVQDSLVYLRNRSRDLIRNNPQAAKACREFQIKAVKTGLICKAKTGKKILDKKTDALWAVFSKSCSADGMANIGAIESLIARSWFESGEVLVRFRYRLPSDGLRVPLQFQVLESDHLSLERTWQVEDGNYIIQGKEFDPMGRLQAYWLWPRHPGEVMYPLKGSIAPQRIPANEVVHFYFPDRPEQVRGIPLNAPVMSTMRNMADYTEAEQVRKRIEACFGIGVTQQEGIDGPGLGAESLNQNGDRLEAINPGMIHYFKPGEQVNVLQPAAGGEYGSFKNEMDHDAAAGQMIPYELMTGNLSQVNYSSYRGSLLSYRDFIEWAIWAVLVPGFDRMRDEFCRIAWLAGELPESSTVTDWGAPAFDLLDRGEEAKADLLEVRTGATTLFQMFAGKGRDPDEQIDEIERINAILDQKKIILDTDPRNVAINGQVQNTGGANAGQQPAPAAA